MDDKQNNDKKFEEVTLETKPVFQGRVISLQVDDVRLPNGRTSSREIVKHPGGVGILAIVDHKMLVVEQYRKPLEKSQIEIPAGKIDPGEDPLETAKRELKEETGYEVKDLEHITSFATSPGFANEILHLYVAKDLTKQDQTEALNLDEDEFLERFSLSLEEALQMVRDGRITDGKTIVAIYTWQSYHLTGQF